MSRPLTIFLSVMFLQTSTVFAILANSKPIIAKYDSDRTVLRKFTDAALSGAISCSITHSLVCPLDVIKTKMQTDPSLAGKSIVDVFQSIVKSGGFKVLMQGLAATSSGYFLQGFCKFGFYDLIKSNIFLTINNEKISEMYRLPILIASSGLAEVVASWALCPLEVTRIYMVMNPQIKSGMLSAMKEIIKNEGLRGFFKGLPLIMVRQVPYTCAKLAGYEVISDNIRKAMIAINIRSRDNSTSSGLQQPHTYKVDGLNPELSSAQKVGIQLCSGITAGVLAAVISQPADVLLSRVCGGANALSECILINGPMDLINTFRSMSLAECYAGLQARAVMVGTLTALQFYVYENANARVATFNLPRRKSTSTYTT